MRDTLPSVRGQSFARLPGFYYARQLRKTTIPTDKTEDKIEKILKEARRGDGGVKPPRAEMELTATQKSSDAAKVVFCKR